MTPDLARRLAGEGLGTGFLLAAIVGSGIMAERLTDDVALALFCNGVATGAALFVLIVMFGPVSGAHFNPVVTIAAYVDRRLSLGTAVAFVGAQIAGAIVGVWVAHLMFGAPVFQAGATVRSGAGLWLSEVVASFGLVLVIRMLEGRALETVAAAVGLYIASAYWFTASTSFANPAVTIARSLSDSFAGIRPLDAPMFIGMQLVGAGLAVLLSRHLRSRHS